MWIPKTLVAGVQLAAVATTYYTVPDQTRAVIKRATLTNTTGTARTVTVYLVSRGATAGVANCVVSAVSVPVSGNRPVDLVELIDHVLERGDFLAALASAGSAISLRVSGLEYS